jgi:hypothetical protein
LNEDCAAVVPVFRYAVHRPLAAGFAGEGKHVGGFFCAAVFILFLVRGVAVWVRSLVG